MAFRKHFWSLTMEGFFNQGTIFACGKLLCLWKISLIMKKNFVCGKIPWSWKLPFLWKISLIKEKNLFVENFHDHEKKNFGEKFPWSEKHFCLRKTFLIMESKFVSKTSLIQENFCLWKAFLTAEKNESFYNFENKYLCWNH